MNPIIAGTALAGRGLVQVVQNFLREARARSVLQHGEITWCLHPPGRGHPENPDSVAGALIVVHDALDSATILGVIRAREVQYPARRMTSAFCRRSRVTL